MRNKIQANTDAFAKFIKASCEYYPISISTGTRWFSTNEEEQKWLKELKIKKPTVIFPKSKCGIFKYDGENYLVISYFSFDNLVDSEIVPFEMNAGIFTVLLAEEFLTIKKNIEAYKITDIVEPSKANYQEYAGHDFNDFLPFFEKINLFKINSDSIISGENIHQTVGYLCSKCYDQNVSLPYSSEVISFFENLFLEPNLNHLAYDNILNALLSVNYKNAFLELYRNIEKLYPVPYIHNLYTATKSPLNFHMFWNSIKKELQWKNKEDQALELLISELEESDKQILDNLLDDSPNPNITKLIYERIRNKIVHFDFFQENIEFDDSKWNKIIQFCLLMNLNLYKKYNPILNYEPNVE